MRIFNLLSKWCSIEHSRKSPKSLRLRVGVALGAGQWQGGTGRVRPGRAVHTGRAVLPPARACASTAGLWGKPHICSEASFYLGIGRTPKQVGKGTRKVHPQMSGSVKHQTVGRCSMRGCGTCVAALPSHARLTLQTLLLCQGLPAFRNPIYLLT